MPHDVKFTDELSRIGRGLASPERGTVLAAADEISRLAAEVDRLESELAMRPKDKGPSPMDEADRKALQRYRMMHYGNNPEHPG